MDTVLSAVSMSSIIDPQSEIASHHEVHATGTQFMGSTDSLFDGSSHLHQFTDPLSDDIWRLGSSPPLAPMDIDDDFGASQVVLPSSMAPGDDEDMVCGGDTDCDEGTDVDDSAIPSPLAPTSTPQRPQIQATPAASAATTAAVSSQSPQTISKPQFKSLSVSSNVGSKGLMRLQPGQKLSSVIRDRSIGLPAGKTNSSFGSFGSFSVATRLHSHSINSVINQAIDDPESVIVRNCFEFQFEDMSLTELPREIGELEHLALFSKGQNIKGVNMFLGRNLLTRLPREIFNVNLLTVLSMRGNKLKQVSPLIRKLTNLKELHLGYNELEYLPAEVLGLPLEVLTVHPNPLLPLPPQFAGGSMRTHCVGKIYTQPTVPALTELCSRELAKNLYTEQIYQRLDLPEQYQDRIKRAVSAYNAGDECSFCHEVFTVQAVQTTEWWNILNQFKIPFRRHYCTEQCWIQDNE